MDCALQKREITPEKTGKQISDDISKEMGKSLTWRGIQGRQNYSLVYMFNLNKGTPDQISIAVESLDKDTVKKTLQDRIVKFEEKKQLKQKQRRRNMLCII